MGDRKITIRLSADAYRGLDKTVRACGVSFTALIEAWGRAQLEDMHSVRADVLEAARAIDAERRRRA